MLQVFRYLNDRMLVHKTAINFCQNILKRKPVDWKAAFRNDVSQAISDVDLVITVGGDGTLLQASHFVDDIIPVLGVNSDPTRPEEVWLISMLFVGLLHVKLYPSPFSKSRHHRNMFVQYFGARIRTEFSNSSQMEQFNEEFDATRSTGFLCASTTNNFEQVKLMSAFCLYVGMDLFKLVWLLGSRICEVVRSG